MSASPTIEPSRRKRRMDSFHLFPGLPSELRELVWFFALPGPRIIEVKPQPLRRGVYINEDNHSDACCSFYAPKNYFAGFQALKHEVPVILSVCHQSRATALRHLRLCLSYDTASCKDKFFEKSSYKLTPDGRMEMNDRQIPIKELIPPGIWIRPDLDTVYFSNPDPGYEEGFPYPGQHLYYDRELILGFEHIQSVAIDIAGGVPPTNLSAYIPDTYPWPMMAAKRLCNLKELYLFTEAHRESSNVNYLPSIFHQWTVWTSITEDAWEEFPPDVKDVTRRHPFKINLPDLPDPYEPSSSLDLASYFETWFSSGRFYVRGNERDSMKWKILTSPMQKLQQQQEREERQERQEQQEQ